MSLSARRFPGGSIARMSIALALLSSPLIAQKTTLTVTGGTVTFPAPTVADYINGYVDAATGVTFAINAVNGSARTTTVTIRATSASLGNGKPVTDLEWRRGDLATWNGVSVLDTQIEQRIVISKGINDPWSNTIFFRMLLDWAKDTPGTYSANYVITLSQTVP
jgi:hypothetical protein